jgi:hypothetical protein
VNGLRQPPHEARAQRPVAVDGDDGEVRVETPQLSTLRETRIDQATSAFTNV